MTQPVQDRVPLGMAFMLGFCALAPLIDVCSKLASQQVSVGEVTLARFLVQGALTIPLLLAYGQSFRLRGRALALTFARATVSILATYCFVGAVQVMPIADALAIAFVEPFIILLLGWAVYGEQVGPRRLGAAITGFLGALLVIQPSFTAFGAVALFPLGTALFFALYILITRQLAPLVHPVGMMTHSAIAAVILWLPVTLVATLLDHDGLPLSSLALSMPSGWTWAFLFGVGLAATVSHMSMSFGLRLAPASTLAPLHYLEMVSSASLGYLVFGNFPDALTWCGIAIIAASGLYIIHRERRQARPLASAPRSPAAELPAAGSPASSAPKTEG